MTKCNVSQSPSIMIIGSSQSASNLFKHCMNTRALSPQKTLKYVLIKNSKEANRRRGWQEMTLISHLFQNTYSFSVLDSHKLTASCPQKRTGRLGCEPPETGGSIHQELTSKSLWNNVTDFTLGRLPTDERKCFSSQGKAVSWEGPGKSPNRHWVYFSPVQLMN